MIIEELNLDSDEESLTENLTEEISDEYNGNIFYSYPYYSSNDFDYQFRITLLQESIKLEEIKCNETELNSLNTIIVTRAYTELSFDKGFQMIQNDIDLRTEEEIKIEKETINYTITAENAEEELENNKKVVLLELYKSILE
jgi:hypothetical protein